MRRWIGIGAALLLVPCLAGAELAFGSTGPEVKRLEERLAELQYLTAQPDERYDRDTSDAVKVFRQDTGLRGGNTADDATLEALYSQDAWAWRLAGLPEPDLDGAAKTMKAAANALKPVTAGDLTLNAAAYDSSFELTLLKGWGQEIRAHFAVRADEPLYSGDTLSAELTLFLNAPPADGLVTFTDGDWQERRELYEGRITLQLQEEPEALAALLAGTLRAEWEGGGMALAEFAELSDEIPARLTEVWESLQPALVQQYTGLAARCREEISE